MVFGVSKTFGLCWGLKVENVEEFPVGDGAGLSGSESMLNMEEYLAGFGGGTLLGLGCFSCGGCGGANLGCSGITDGSGLEMDIDDAELVEPVDKGLSGAVDGGFTMDKSSFSLDRGGFGAGIEGG